MFDINEVEKQARQEVQEEQKSKAIEKMKTAIKKLSAARAVVRNIEREIEELKVTIAEDVQ